MSHRLPRLALALFTALLAAFWVHARIWHLPAGWRTAVRSLPDARLAPTPTYDLAPITALIEGAVRRIPLRGASLLLIKDGAVIYERAFGAIALDTAVPIASGSKWLTAATIMTLVDDGLIGLDDPVAKHLPDVQGPVADVTVRQLLSHTSGLPNLLPCLDDSSITLAECARQIAETGLPGPPGRLFSYSSSAFQVAGAIAEVASGEPWAELFEKKVKGPLGMAATSYGDTSNPVLGGGVVTTLGNYGRFLQMLLDGGTFEGRRILSPQALREMQRDQTRGATIEVSLHQDGRRYGLGCWLDAVDEQGNATQLSSQGDTGFSPWIDRERNLLGVFLVEDGLGNVYSLVEEIQARTREIVGTGGG